MDSPNRPSKHVARQLTIDARPQQWAVGHDDATRTQSFPPRIVRQSTATVHIDAVVADRIVQHSRRTAGGRGDANTAVENVIVDVLRPIARAA